MNKSTKNAKSKLFATSLAVTALLIASSTVASANPTSVSNGDFEIGDDGATSITGWTAINSRIDLGVTSIAGCVTVDTSDYTTLREFSTGDHSGSITSDPSANNDSADTTAVFDEAVVRLKNLTLEDDPDFGHDSQFLELFSDVSSESEGYVVHGPAVYSEIFSARTVDDLTLDWAATDESDDYHVFGYLLNTDTCAQTEVIDSTGELSSWQNEVVAVPADGNYRFVFVSGTFDQSFGSAAGAALYVDNVTLTPNLERSRPLALDLALDATIGGIVPGGQVLLQGGGLIANSPLELIMRSTPVTINLNGQTADASGNFSFRATLPASIPAGVHSLTLTGTKPDGNPISDVLYFEIDAAGKLLWVQADTPKLANTGVNTFATGGLLVVGLGLIGFGVAIAASRRSKKA